LQRGLADDVIPPQLREIGQEWLIAFAFGGMEAARTAGRPELLKSIKWLDDPEFFRQAWLIASRRAMHWAPSVTLEYLRSFATALANMVEEGITLEDEKYKKQEDIRREEYEKRPKGGDQ
jgi:hypothetical protein